jgi:alkanesulfonate monooxygenase SsuD/methylene tetrahydromethanopterin reductase-like flavin-dependent oxidoreductase (luciferase family)
MARDAIAEQGGQTFGVVTRVAPQLGVDTESLRNWLKQAEIDAGGRPGTSTADAQRIAGLEGENRELFTEPVVDFSGRFDRVARASLVPKPARSIPIWLGGSGEAAFDRAARLADGFIFFGGGIDPTVDAWRRLHDRLGGLGRSVEGFGTDYVSLSRSVIDLTAEIDAWRDAGGTHVSVVTMGLGLDSVDGHIDYLASVADALSLS